MTKLTGYYNRIIMNSGALMGVRLNARLDCTYNGSGWILQHESREGLGHGNRMEQLLSTENIILVKAEIYSTIRT